MSRRHRHEKRLQAEQDTVGMRRAERAALDEMSRQKIQARSRPEQEPAEPAAAFRPRRQARPGKPLKR